MEKQHNMFLFYVTANIMEKFPTEIDIVVKL